MDEPSVAMPDEPPQSMPVFCMIVFIFDLMLCLLRFVLFALSAIGTFAIFNQGASALIVGLAIGETLTGCCMGILGPIADGLLLFKKKIGFMLGLIVALGTLMSIVIGVTEAFVFPKGSTNMVGVGIGAAFSGFVRLVLLGTYVAALFVFSKWKSKQREA